MQQPEVTPLSASQKLALLSKVLQERSYDAGRDMLESLARDQAACVREQALVVFWKLTDPDFIEQTPDTISLDPSFIDCLIETAAHDDALPVRVEAIRALGRYVYEGFRRENLHQADYKLVKEFLWDLYHQNEEPLNVRRTALEALGYITDEDIEKLIREAYCSPERMMRISALFAMGRSGMDVTWDDILLKELLNPDPEIRFEAARAAGETYMSVGGDILERLTQDPHPGIRIAAIKALGNAGRPQARAALRQLLHSPDEDVRNAASEALNALDYFQSEALTED